MHGSIRVPPLRRLGRPRKLTSADEEVLLGLLLSEGWRQQKELVFWLWCERNLLVHRSTVSRVLKRRKWTQRELRRLSLNQSEALRDAWREEIRRFVAEDLVFIDESIFNEKTGWRHRGYGPIGSDARYPADINRGRTWSILPAMTVNGYLPCTGVKEGYYKTFDVLNWLRTALLPALRQNGDARPRVVILDNVSVHIDAAITEAIEAEGHLVRFLPPYSPDFNPIELSFSVLKAWFHRNYVWTRSLYSNFGEYVVWAIGASKCDRFAREQFRHAAGGLYLEEGELQRFYDWISAWERGDIKEHEEGIVVSGVDGREIA